MDLHSIWERSTKKYTKKYQEVLRSIPRSTKKYQEVYQEVPRSTKSFQLVNLYVKWLVNSNCYLELIDIFSGGKRDVVAYRRQETYLLPAPYATNRFNYSKIGCQSIWDCVDKCKVELNLKQRNVLPTFINIDILNDKDYYEENDCTKSWQQSIRGHI